ncbi:MAG: hypothetical protein A2W19_09405 [Spirochaetes bacterium RBG_16_49_21]|nr:MAG: hypothetical protein A2W19_09405 [Spirochaetes bacterium RBG_16_49_21]
MFLWIDMEAFKNKFPFKLGATSYVLSEEEDNLMANIRFVMERFDMIQLLFMGRDYLHEVMSPPIIRELEAARGKSGVLYTVHLPADLDLLNPEEERVRGSIGVIERIIAETRPLDIQGYILHLDRFLDGFGRVDLTGAACRVFQSSLDMLADRLGGDARNIYIENTTYDLTYFKDIIVDRPFPICMDAGHLFFFNQDYEGFIKIFGRRIRQIHLHGFRDGKDHAAVSELKDAEMSKIVTFQRKFSCPLLLEVFNLDDLEKSAEHLVKHFIKS